MKYTTNNKLLKVILYDVRKAHSLLHILCRAQIILGRSCTCILVKKKIICLCNLRKGLIVLYMKCVIKFHISSYFCQCFMQYLLVLVVLNSDNIG